MNILKNSTLLILLTFSSTVFAEIQSVNYVPQKPNKLGISGFDLNELKAITSGDNEVFLSGFRANPEFQASHEQLIFFAKPMQAIKGQLLLGNFTKEQMEYDIISLVNYQQVSFKVDNKLVNKHTVTLEPKLNRFLTIEIAGLKQGIHDLTILAIRKSNKKFKIKIKNRAIKLFHALSVHRANVIVGKGSLVKPQYQKIKKSIQNKEFQGIVINDHSDIKNFGPVSNVKVPTTGILNYNIHFANNSKKALSSAMLVFVNGLQTDFKLYNKGTSKTSVYYKQKKDTVSVLPIEITVPDATKVKDIFVISVDSPFSILVDDSDKMADIPNDVHLSNIIKFETSIKENK